MVRFVVLFLAVICLGGLGYLLTTFRQNAEKQNSGSLRKLDSPSTVAAEQRDFLKYSADAEWLKAETILQLLTPSPVVRQTTMQRIKDNWRPGYLANLVELFSTAGMQVPPLGAELVNALEEITGESFGFDPQEWMSFVWRHELELSPDYAEFKKQLYRRTDEQFAEYFDDDPVTEIPWNEVVWGGVFKDGIPPLRNPEMIAAAEADYLADTNVVFGIEINGDVRAYPKRILAHHEMFTDTIGGVSVCGVY